MRRWLRPTRLPLLIAWLVIIGVVVYLGTNPRLVAPYASGLVSQYLLRIENGGLRVRDFRFRAFEGMELYGVALTLPGRSGGMTIVSADTVGVDFGLAQVLGAVPHLKRVTVRRPEVFSMAGSDTSTVPDQGEFKLQLPRLIIDQLVVSGAFLEFSNADGRLAQRISRLDWTGSLQTGAVARAVLRGVNIDWDTHDSSLADLRGEVIIDRQGIAVRSLLGTLNGHFVRIGGYRNWDKSLRLQVEGVDVSVAEVENLIDQRIGFKARGNLVGLFEAANDSLHYSGTFSGEVEGFEVTDLAASAVVGGGEVRLTELRGMVNGAGFSGVGHFDVSRPENVKFVLEGDAVGVDLAKGLVPGEDDLPRTDGRGRLRIEHTDVPMWTRVSGVLTDGFIEIVPFDTCFVDVEAHVGGLDFREVQVFYRDLHAMLIGSADTAEVFRGTLSLNSEDLSTLPVGWQWPDLAGRANGAGHVSGPLDALVFVGDLKVYDLGLDLMAASVADVALRMDDVLGDVQVGADINGHGFVVGGVPLGDFVLRGTASAAAARVDIFAASQGDTSVSLSFGASFSDTLNHLLVEQLGITLEGTHWVLGQPVPLGVGAGHFSLSGLRLSSEQGAVSGGGIFERGVQVSGGLQFESFNLGLLNPFVETREPLAGMMTADVVAGGDPEAPTLTLTGTVVDAPFALAYVDSLAISADYHAGTVTFRELDLLSDYGRVRTVGTVSNPGAAVDEFWAGAGLNLELEFVDADWAFLDQFALPALDRLSGRFNGALTVAGTVREPVMQGALTSSPFHLHWLHLSELSATVAVDSRQLVLGDLRGHKDELHLRGRIEVPLVLDLMSEPLAPLDGPFLMQLEIPAGSNLAPLADATNAFVTSSGTGQAAVTVSGPLGHPLYQGSLRIDGANFVLRDLEEVYRDASCVGSFSGDTLTLSRIRGREGLRGEFAGSGSVTFRGLEVETFDLRLDLDRFLLASIPDLRVVASSRNARMTGVMVGPDSVLVPKFHGAFTVHKARYTGDFKEKQGATDPLLGTVAPDWLADLSLHAEPRVAHIANREMELALGGDLNLVRTADGLNMRGSLDVNKGVLVVFNNKFQVLRGRLDFSQEVGFDPRIDLDAETRYRLRFAGSSNSIVEHIGVHVGGLMSSPEVRFSSERGYSTEAIQRMLLGLEPHATPEGDSRRLANSSISAGLNLIEREIAREVDIVDTIEIDQIQRQRETGDPGLDPLIGVGKYIGSDLYLKYAQGIRGMDDLDIIVEYQINQHLLLQSEIRRRLDENQGESTYNLDFKYRFEY